MSERRDELKADFVVFWCKRILDIKSGAEYISDIDLMTGIIMVHPRYATGNLWSPSKGRSGVRSSKELSLHITQCNKINKATWPHNTSQREQCDQSHNSSKKATGQDLWPHRNTAIRSSITLNKAGGSRPRLSHCLSSTNSVISTLPI
jgi:hypothetical protein